MKLLYLIAGTYRAAGMEKVLADKANWFAAHGHEVVIATTDQRGQEPAFAMDPSIRQIDLGINYENTNGAWFLVKAALFPFKKFMHKRRLKALLKAEKPDITVSMFCNDAGFLPKIQDGSKKVLEVHFSRFKRLQYGRKGIWALADKFLSDRDAEYVRAFDRFVVLTEEDKGYWGDLPNMVVIPNGVPRKEQAPLEAHTVIAVGRYSFQKSLDRLITAWSLIEDRGDWKLKLVGDGECRDELFALINELGLYDTVELTGVQKDMESVYRNASILALSSRYEGLPMVLLEAEAHGLPCVSFDCQCGPKDVIRDGENGRLVPTGDIDALARVLSETMHNPAAIRRMGAAAWEDALRWEPETIMQQWLKLFEGLL